MTGLDYAIIIVFLTAIAAAGATVSRLIRNADDLFVAGPRAHPLRPGRHHHRHEPPACSTSWAMGRDRSQSGVSIIWMNWTGGIALTLSGLFVLPIHAAAAQIRSVPEYLELRYARGLRTLVGAFWGLQGLSVLCISTFPSRNPRELDWIYPTAATAAVALQIPMQWHLRRLVA